MITPNEFLKEVSPNEEFGVLAELKKIRLSGVVCEYMKRYAELYHEFKLNKNKEVSNTKV